jgi:hypothetical protein
MRLDIGAVQLTAKDVKIVGVPPFMELQIDGTELIVTDSEDGRLWVRSATGSILVTESAINRAITSISVDKVSDLDLKTYNGFARISGRYQVLGAVSAPFTITAAPEIESGARLRLAVRDFSVAGAIPMPSFVINMLAARINEQLGKAFDVTRLPVPIRLTGVTVEPGRLKLSAKLEMPPESAPGATKPEESENKLLEP